MSSCYGVFSNFGMISSYCNKCSNHTPPDAILNSDMILLTQMFDLVEFTTHITKTTICTFIITCLESIMESH